MGDGDSTNNEVCRTRWYIHGSLRIVFRMRWNTLATNHGPHNTFGKLTISQRMRPFYMNRVTLEVTLTKCSFLKASQPGSSQPEGLTTWQLSKHPKGVLATNVGEIFPSASAPSVSLKL